MRFTTAILALAMTVTPDISIFDSKVHPGKSWILIDDCAVEVDTIDFKYDSDKIVQKVNDFCGLNLDHVDKKE